MSRRLSTRHQNNIKKAPSETVGPDTDERPSSTIEFVGVKQYYTQEQRLKSFTAPPTRKRPSSAKKGGKASKWSWPANNPAAELMARAGFYFKPTAGEEDNAACFLCQKNMSCWEPEDDPAEQHGRHGTSCGWALTMCRELVVEGKIVTDPLGEQMSRARRMTFDKWWPHDNKKEWKPTVENVVTAGFIFRPRGEGDDTVYCPYCSLSIDAWEQNDDPIEAHKSLGSGDCVFLRHIKDASTSTTTENENKNIQEKAAEEVEEKSKRRVSRARKTPITSQKKKATPRGQHDPNEQQNTGSKSRSNEDDGKDSRKPARGKKRGSTAMEEGGKKLLFLNKDGNTKTLDGQQPTVDDHEAQKPRPAKRRVTRASMVNQPPTLDLAVNVPDYLAVDDDDSGLISSHNTPIKLKAKEKKKATRSSTAAVKTGKGAKKIASKTPVNVRGPSDEEIDRELEREITDGHRANNEVKIAASAGIPNPEPENLGISDNSPESEAAQEPVKKLTRRLTKTKPASRRSPTPDLEDTTEGQEQQQTKLRRKKLTRTKCKTSDSTDVQPIADDINDLEDSTKKETPPETPPTGQTASDEVGSVNLYKFCDDPASRNPAQTTIPRQLELPHPSPETKTQLEFSAFGTETNSRSYTVEAVTDGGEISDSPKENIHNSQIAPPDQLVTAPTTSTSPTKDKDMKRKSDVVTDDGQDRRTSKKRKTGKLIKVAKSRVSPKKKETAPSASPGVPPNPRHADKVDITVSKTPTGNIAQVVQKSTRSGEPLSCEPVSTEPSKKFDVPEEVPSSHDDSVTEEQETVLDDFGDNCDTGADEARLAIMKGSTTRDNTIDVILDGSRKPCETVPRNEVQAETTPITGSGNAPSSPCPPSDFGSQDSIPNTQFSAPASQMTVATSFHGSMKGVSFVKTTEGPLSAEEDSSPTEEIRERSVIASPKQARTPLSILSKPHNGAVALMTPRNRAEDVSFAPVQSQKPWKSTDVEVYIDELKENQEIEVQANGLSESERNMTVAEWIMNVSKRAEKQLVQKGELLVRFFEDEAERAVSAIEAIETE